MASQITDEDGARGGGTMTTSKKCHDSFWKGQYCCVPKCRHASGGSDERSWLGCGRVSFHSFPDLLTDKEGVREWIVKI